MSIFRSLRVHSSMKTLKNKRKDKLARDSAARVLVEMDDEGIIESLIQLLNNETAQRSVAIALGEIGEIRAVEPLIQLLMNGDQYVRSIAAGALGKIKDKKAVEPLIQILASGEITSKVAAAQALGELGDTKATEALILALSDTYPDIRQEAAEALGKIKDTRAIPSLLLALKDNENKVRTKAVNSLGMMRDASSIEAVLDEIFSNSQLSPNHESMRSLFNDYTDLILKAAYTHTADRAGERSDYKDRNSYSYEYDLSISDEAIQKLCEIQTQISTNILHKILRKKKDISVTMSVICDIQYSDTLSFATQREMAKKEIKKREASYDPDAYLERKNWKR